MAIRLGRLRPSFLADSLLRHRCAGKDRSKGKGTLFHSVRPICSIGRGAGGRVLLIYALLVFSMGFFEPHEGSLNRVDGRPVLSEKGKVIRELTEREYIHLKAAQMRGFSAILLCFSRVSTLELLSLVLREKKNA
jgi:hypothetical protein